MQAAVYRQRIESSSEFRKRIVIGGYEKKRIENYFKNNYLN